jgi:uncharacterized membrane protein HdeD (DUF308 family)
MDKWPQPLWAVVLCAMGAVLALAVLFHNPDVNLALAVLGVGSNLVSGGLGAIAGHASSGSKADVTTEDTQVTIDPK